MASRRRQPRAATSDSGVNKSHSPGQYLTQPGEEKASAAVEKVDELDRTPVRVGLAVLPWLEWTLAPG